MGERCEDARAQQGFHELSSLHGFPHWLERPGASGAVKKTVARHGLLTLVSLCNSCAPMAREHRSGVALRPGVKKTAIFFTQTIREDTQTYDCTHNIVDCRHKEGGVSSTGPHVLPTCSMSIGGLICSRSNRIRWHSSVDGALSSSQPVTCPAHIAARRSPARR